MKPRWSWRRRPGWGPLRVAFPSACSPELALLFLLVPCGGAGAQEPSLAERIFALLRERDTSVLARSHDELERSFTREPSFDRGARLLAICDRLDRHREALELGPVVLAQAPAIADAPTLDAVAMVYAFLGRAHHVLGLGAEERGELSVALRHAALGESQIGGFLRGEHPFALNAGIQRNLLRARALLLALETRVLFAVGEARLARRALELRRAVLQRFSSALPDPADPRAAWAAGGLVECAALLAESARVAGDFDRARAALAEAGTLLAALSAPPPAIAATYQRIRGLVAEDGGKLDVAEQAYRAELAALDAQGGGGPASERADAERCLGDIQRKRRDLPASLSHYERAASLAAGLEPSLALRHAAQIAYRRALAYGALARPEKARAQLLICFETLDELQRVAPELGSGGVFGLRETRAAVEEWLSLNIRLGRDDVGGVGLEQVERIRARGLLRALSAPPERAPSPAETRVSRLRARAWLRADPQLGQVRSDLVDAILRLRLARDGGRGDRVAELSGGEWFARVQRRLRARASSALVYFMGPHSLWVWLLDGARARVVRVPVESAVLARRVRAFFRAAATPPAGQSGSERLARLRIELQRWILPPSFDRELARRMCIVPDGALHLLPWAAVLPEEVRASQVVPSLAALLRLEEGVGAIGAPRDRILVVGGVVGVGHSDEVLRSYLAATPRARQEALALQRRFAPRAIALIAGAATEQAVRQALGEKDLCAAHFNVHGLYDPYVPSSSGLVLEPDAREDGFLWADEIASVGTVPPLVVLNSCSTGRGELIPSEGVAGLARSFLESGAVAVVATLWEVGDEVALRFAEGFYDSLQRGDDAASSTASGIARVRARFPDPFHWGGYLLIGDGGYRLPALLRAVKDGREASGRISPWLLGLSFVGLAALVGIALVWLRRRSAAP